MNEQLRNWIGARGAIEDVEIPKIWNIGAGGKTIVGRLNASRIMKALDAAGYDVVPRVNGQETQYG